MFLFGSTLLRCKSNLLKKIFIVIILSLLLFERQKQKEGVIGGLVCFLQGAMRRGTRKESVRL